MGAILPGKPVASPEADAFGTRSIDESALPDRLVAISSRGRGQGRVDHCFVRLAAFADDGTGAAGEFDLAGKRLLAGDLDLQGIGFEERSAIAAGTLIGNVERDRALERKLSIRLVWITPGPNGVRTLDRAYLGHVLPTVGSIIVGSTDVGRHESADLGLGSATKFSSGAKVIDQVRVAHCTAAKRCWPHAMLGKEAFCFCEDARVAHQSDLVGRFRQVQSETSGFAENHACGKYPTCRSPII
ncbi:hypothetical protein WR25_19864 [Diploscapter pachys]|uniref:Uncharacterized protein n=1 Tax=Diploscapter pachys TaxID=2018661 RepID=A0A2A2JWC8_9BILA|nr:hypothetical protein WR25_19864 [Diploscapter pachys]